MEVLGDLLNKDRFGLPKSRVEVRYDSSYMVCTLSALERSSIYPDRSFGVEAWAQTCVGCCQNSGPPQVAGTLGIKSDPNWGSLCSAYLLGEGSLDFRSIFGLYRVPQFGLDFRVRSRIP